MTKLNEVRKSVKTLEAKVTKLYNAHEEFLKRGIFDAAPEAEIDAIGLVVDAEDRLEAQRSVLYEMEKNLKICDEQ